MIFMKNRRSMPVTPLSPRQSIMSRFFGSCARAAVALAILVTGAVAADPAPPAIDDISSYTRCAGEYQSFVLPGSCDVAYGANGLYVFKTGQSGTVVFSNGTFGDPIPGVAKSGYYRTTVVYPPSDPTGTGTGLTGDYYDNIFVKGFSKRRIDPMINFPWGGADPMPGIAAGAYSVRWTGKIQTRYDDTYTLITTSDDGVRVWVDGQPIINDWTTHGNTENTGTFVSLAGQKHDIRIEYFEGGGGAFMRLEWQSAHQARALVPTSCLFSQGADTPAVLPTYVPGTGTGLTGDYRNYSDLSGSHIRRLDPIINFRWGDGSPDSHISTDNFTVRWTGQIQTRFDGDCTLSTISDDGVLLYLDGKLLINDWTTHGDKENTCTFASKAGQKHDIRIEYFESGGGADMYLKWQSANEGYTLVPTSCLYPYNMANAIPASSTVSPAFIEGFYGFTAATLNTGVVSDLGDSHFYANIPLSITGATSVALTEGSTTAAGNISWTSTLLSGEKKVIVRPKDSLLVEAAQSGTWRVTLNCGPYQAEAPIVAGAKIPVLFPKPGVYLIETLDALHAVNSSLSVTVPGIDFGTYIACEVNYQRIKDVTFNAAADSAMVTLSSPDTWIEVGPGTVPAGSAPTLQRLTVKPTMLQASVLTARIGGLSGPIMAQQTIKPFTIRTSATNVVGVAEHYNDNSLLCSAELVMSPLLPDLDVYMYIFVAGVTFADSTTKQWLQSNSFTLGSDGFGHLPYGLIRGPGVQSGICHAWQVYQDGVTVSH